MSSGSRSRSVLRRPPSGRSALIGNRPFRRLWAGSALSMAGTRTLGVCYPLLAFTLTESPTWTGWVMFAWTLPGLLCFLPAGVLADRVGHQRVMMWSEAIRGALVTTLCAGLLLGWLRVDVLLLIAFAEGGLSVVSAIAETALIPSVATPREMNTALAVHETTVHTVVLAGRPLGGLLFGLWPALPFLANVVFFTLSTSAVRGVREAGKSLTRPAMRLLPEICSGIREVRRDPFLWPAMVITAITNLVFNTVSMIFISEATLSGLHPVLFGLILAASGIGGAVGAFISPSRDAISARISEKTSDRPRMARLTDWIGLTRQGRSMLLVHVWACAVALTLTFVLALTPLAFATAMLLIGLAGGLSNVTIRTMFNRVPVGKTARVISVFRLGSYGTVALGPLLGNFLFQNFGTRTALVTLTLSVWASALATTFIPSLRRKLSPLWEVAASR
ncbi:MAG TPA: MFS transporter [Thermopolyspora sp.]|jgi:Arabinose efflux permease